MKKLTEDYVNILNFLIRDKDSEVTVTKTRGMCEFKLESQDIKLDKVIVEANLDFMGIEFYINAIREFYSVSSSMRTNILSYEITFKDLELKIKIVKKEV